MQNLNAMRHPLAVRWFVGPSVRLVLAATLLLCLFGFWVWSFIRPFTAKARAAKTAEKPATRKPAMHLGNAMEALKLAQALADECGAKPFLVSGTLLGFHRNGKLLAHDNDLDLGIFADDAGLAAYLHKLKTHPQVNCIVTKRLHLLDRLANPSVPKLLDDVILYKVYIECIEGAPPVRLDLFVHFAMRGAVAHGSRCTLWLNSDLTLSPMEIEGHPFWAPSDRARYLTENYGDFSVPKINFESFVDCPNGVNILTVPACIAIAKKWAMFRRLGDVPRMKLVKARIMSLIKSGFGRLDSSEAAGLIRNTVHV